MKRSKFHECQFILAHYKKPSALLTLISQHGECWFYLNCTYHINLLQTITSIYNNNVNRFVTIHVIVTMYQFREHVSRSVVSLEMEIDTMY